MTDGRRLVVVATVDADRWSRQPRKSGDVAMKMTVDVALVAGRVVALAAGEEATADRDDAGRSSTLSAGGRPTASAAVATAAAAAVGGVVDDGMTTHQRPASKPTPAFGARVPRSSAVPLRHVFTQFRLADEGQSATLERALAAFMHRRAVASKVVLPVRRVPTVRACVWLRRPNASGLNNSVTFVIVVG